MSWTSSIADNGAFVRKASGFRRFVSNKADAEFPAVSGRYHLYLSLACPWAHRVLIFRALKGLEAHLSITVVDWFLNKETGWRFSTTVDKCEAEPLFGFDFLKQIYLKSDPSYTGNITVPVLFDKQTSQIVNNESSEIIRMLNSEFNHLSATPEQAKLDFYPEDLRSAIDAINAPIYDRVNNGVYKSGFAKSQSAYEEAVTALFAQLDELEDILGRQRYLTGARLTEADIRLFTTLIRFDLVYQGHFKCNLRCLREYKNLHHYMLEIYQMPAVKPTVDFVHCKNHYYVSHEAVNPTRIYPKGPFIDFDAPHGRDALFPSK